MHLMMKLLKLKRSCRRSRKAETGYCGVAGNKKRKKIPLSLSPVKDITGEYKLGIWVRDNTQGIGPSHLLIRMEITEHLVMESAM